MKACVKARGWITIILSTALSLAVVSVAQAQTGKFRANISRKSSSSTMKLIPTVGYSAGFFEGSVSDADYKTEARSSFNGGLLVEMGKGLLTFQSGLLYLQEGNKWSASRNTATSRSSLKVDHRLDYMGVPALMKLNLPSDERSTRFTLKIGVTPALLLAAQSRSETTETTALGTQNKVYEVTTKDGVRAVNIMGNAGIGLEIPGGASSSNDIRIEAQYARGLLPAGQQDDIKIYTQSVMLTIGMGFGL